MLVPIADHVWQTNVGQGVGRALDVTELTDGVEEWAVIQR
jgi:hypothetical protein